jgi:hypothetical protein
MIHFDAFLSNLLHEKTFFFVASYAESRLSQGNLNQPDVAF